MTVCLACGRIGRKEIVEMASGESLEAPVNKQKSIKTDRDKQRFLPNHHRMYRSPVRPFFCCGSQISLNSITEFKEGAVLSEKDADDDYEDVQTDSDDFLEEVDKLVLESLPKKHDRALPRMGRTPLNGKRKKSSMRPEKSTARKKFWSLKLKGGKLQVSKRSHYASASEVCSPTKENEKCVCTSIQSKHNGSTRSLGAVAGAESGQEGSHINNDGLLGSLIAQGIPQASTSSDDNGARGSSTQDKEKNKGKVKKRGDFAFPFININNLYPINDIDEQLIAQRRHEMEHGIDMEDVWILKQSQSESESNKRGSFSSLVCSSDIKKSVGQYPSYGAMALLSSEAGNMDPADLISKQKRSSIDEDMSSSNLNLSMSPWVPNVPQQQGQGRGQFQVHTQVDYIHFLVPDLDKIIRSSFYWGVMDRYQAEKLIENKPEGTFLLRDSAQDEFLFSVSFRRYGRSLHARIEQWNHKFSFDSRDPGVFATDTVCGLIDHYKDPSCCMFFEPMLTRPLNRTFPFSLQHLSRSVICSRITYDGISELTLPRSLKEYLQFYHYKQKVRVRRFDNVA